MAKVTKAPPSKSPPRPEVMRCPYTMGPGSHDATDGLHGLRRRPPALQSAALWSLFDGGREALNIAVECLTGMPAPVASRSASPTPTGATETLGFRDLSGVVRALRALARGARRRARRPRGDHARAVAGLLRRPVRRHQARRHRGAAVHPVRARRCPAAGRRLHAAAPADQRREGRHRARHRRARGRGGRRRVRVHAGGAPGQLRGAERRRRPRGLSVHVGHDARAAGGGAPSPARDRRAHGRSALRHGHPAGRSLLLPVLARVGARPLARHAQRRWRSASPPGRWPASSTRSGCSARCRSTT